MSFQPTRRSFLVGAGAIAATAALPSFGATGRLKGLRYGYAAMPWGTDERKAIADIAAAGYPAFSSARMP
jgi:inosose dehydratase